MTRRAVLSLVVGFYTVEVVVAYKRSLYSIRRHWIARFGVHQGQCVWLHCPLFLPLPGTPRNYFPAGQVDWTRVRDDMCGLYTIILMLRTLGLCASIVIFGVSLLTPGEYFGLGFMLYEDRQPWIFLVLSTSC
jgi:hypothetical protein